MNKILAAISGIILGFLFTKLLFLQYLTLLPWGIAALVFGNISKTKKESLTTGAIYGFFLGFVFTLGIYQGALPIFTRIPFFIILGLVSAICATILSLVGFYLRRKFILKTK